jgi:hypothetical protein
VYGSWGKPSHKQTPKIDAYASHKKRDRLAAVSPKSDQFFD